MTERVCSQSTLHTAGINQDYFVFAQIWEQRCLGKKKKSGEEGRTGTAERGGETAFQAARSARLPWCQSSERQIYLQMLGL